jgi:hypothetical protein
MYSTTGGAEGSVTLQLRDTDDLDDKSGLASVLARLQQEDATLSISYQDSEMLTEGSIDVLLGTGSLHSTGESRVRYLVPEVNVCVPCSLQNIVTCGQRYNLKV